MITIAQDTLLELNDSVVQKLFLAAACLLDWSEALTALTSELGAIGLQLLLIHSRSRQLIESHASAGGMFILLPAFEIGEQDVPARVDGLGRQIIHLADGDDVTALAVLLSPANEARDAMSGMRRGERHLSYLKDAARAALRYRRLRRDGQAAMRLVEASDRPMLLIDAQRAILACNPAARALLASAAIFVDCAGVLNGVPGSNERVLANAVARAALNDEERGRPRRQALRLATRSGEPVIGTLLDVTSHEPRATGQASLRLLVWIAIAAPGDAADVRFLEALFQLSTAEARIGSLLCAGHDAADIARLRQTSVSTVRAQIRSLMQKTGTRRQPELVRLLVCALR